MIIIIKSSFVVISAIIGAAFASGKEIQIFFDIKYTVISIVFNSIMFVLLPYLLYLKLIKYDINDYKSFVSLNFKKCSRIVLFISLMLSFSTYVAMVNAAKVMIPFGNIILTLAVILTLLKDLKGIETISFVATPIMIIGILANSLLSVNCSMFNELKSYTYSAYNILSAFPLMCCMKNMIKNKKNALKSSLISGLVLSLLMVFIHLSVRDIVSPMPMLKLSKENGIYSFYVFIMFSAIFTTAVSSGKGFYESAGIDRRLSCFILAICGIIFSLADFEWLIKTITTVFGFAGLIIVLYSIFKIP